MNCPRTHSAYFLVLWLSWSVLTAAVAQDAPPQPSNPKSPPEALNLFADAASFQNNGAFELAAEEWEKFLKQFPKDPLAIKARHYAGVCQLQLKRFEPAAKHFAAVLAQDPKFELAEEASINLGWCQFSLAGPGNKESFDRAVETFAAHLTRFPQGKFLDQAEFYLGEAHFALGRREEAIKAYRKMLDDHPKSSLRADALYALGVAQEESKQFDEAGKVYDAFVREFPNSDLVNEVRMRKGETLFQTGKVAEAEQLFAEIAKKPGFMAADHALFRQADCAARQDKFVDAAGLYAKVANDYPESAYRQDALAAAGRCYYRAEKLDEAAEWLEKTVAQQGKDATEAAHWLCRIHLKKNEPQKAISLAEKQLAAAGESTYLVHLKMDQADALYELAEWKPDSIDRYVAIATEHPEHELAPQALYNASFAALELKRFPAAAGHAAAFKQKYPQDRLLPDALYVAAECQLLQSEFGQAERVYRELIAQFPEHAESNVWRVRLGFSLYLQKKYSDSVQALEEALGKLKKPEQLAEAHFLIGACQFEQGQPASAVTALEKSLAAQPKWRQADETLLFLSRSQKALNKPAEAAATVQKLLKEFPESKLLDQAHYRLGEYQDAAGNHPAAIGSYDVVLTTYPSSAMAPYAAYGKGWAQLRSKEYPGAIASFTKLLADHADHPLAADAYFARAMSYRQAGEFAKGIEDIAAFLKTNPEAGRKSDALYERGLAQAALKQYAEAAQTFETLLNENQDYAQAPNVLYELAWARKNGGQNAEAAAAFNRLAAEHANSTFAPEALYHVGEEHYQQRQFAEAIQAYSSAMKSAQGEVAENVLHKLGWSHFRLSQYEQALPFFREQIEKFAMGSLAADALFMQAECLFKLQQYQDAWTVFQASIKTPATSPQMQALAYLHGGQSAAQLEHWDDSISLLNVIPEKYSDSTYAAEALYERGWAKQNLKKLDEAIADYEQAATKSRTEVGARARFMIGEIQFERKDHAEAIKSFLRVMYGYGGEAAPDLVKNWQGSAGYEAGRCAEVQVNSADDAAARQKWIQDAKTYYTFVVEKHPNHKLAGEAKQRLMALAQLK